MAKSAKKKDKSKTGSTIALNKKARHNYILEDRLEAGLALEGWEVKSLRAGNLQLKESYVMVKNGEMWLIGAHITPLSTASTHVKADPKRTRKLLAHNSEIHRLVGLVEGPTSMTMICETMSVKYKGLSIPATLSAMGLNSKCFGAQMVCFFPCLEAVSAKMIMA